MTQIGLVQVMTKEEYVGIAYTWMSWMVEKQKIIARQYALHTSSFL